MDVSEGKKKKKKHEENTPCLGDSRSICSSSAEDTGLDWPSVFISVAEAGLAPVLVLFSGPSGFTM